VRGRSPSARFCLLRAGSAPLEKRRGFEMTHWGFGEPFAHIPNLAHSDFSVKVVRHRNGIFDCGRLWKKVRGGDSRGPRSECSLRKSPKGGAARPTLSRSLRRGGRQSTGRCINPRSVTLQSRTLKYRRREIDAPVGIAHCPKDARMVAPSVETMLTKNQGWATLQSPQDNGCRISNPSWSRNRPQINRV
jgi:hypothetical protein